MHQWSSPLLRHDLADRPLGVPSLLTLGVGMRVLRRVWVWGAVAMGIAGLAPLPADAASPDRVCENLSRGGVSATRLSALRRGFNLTGWVDHRVGAIPRRPGQELLNKLAGLGFAHVRLPLAAELVMPEFATEDAIGSTLAELDDALKQLFAAGLAVSIDVHSGGGFQALHKRDPEAGFRGLAGLWHRLATRYAAQDPDRLYFELLNEPAINPDLWRAQALSLITSIREFSPKRTIVYGAARFSRYDHLIAGVPLAADNIVYAVHFYDPMPFTHQGANWSGSDPYRFYHGIPFPAAIDDDRIDLLTAELGKQRRHLAVSTLQKSYGEPWTEARIEREIAKVGEWATRMNAAVIINEFGVLAWRVAPADRMRWLKAVRGAAETNCIGWAHWEFADAFGFVRLGKAASTVDAGVVEALLGPIGQ